MSAEFKLTGLQELLANFQRLGHDTTDATAPALVQEAESIMTASKHIVPVDQGVLRASGYVAPPEIHGNDVSVEIGYGGAASDYALVQHERLDFNHPGGGEAKYLEKPFMAAERGMDQRMANAVWRAIEGMIH